MDIQKWRALIPAGVDYASLRLVTEETETVAVRRNLLQPLRSQMDAGAMVTVHVGAGQGYAATADLSLSGLSAALNTARQIATAAAQHALFDARLLPRHPVQGHYQSPQHQRWEDFPLSERIALLSHICAQLKIDARIVDWESSLTTISAIHQLFDSDGTEITQHFSLVAPDLQVVAHAKGQTQRRSHGLRGLCRQGGPDMLTAVGFAQDAQRMAEEALQLLDAPECPTDRRDLLLAPDQMMLQIHESIGHPLELDRILGDERNFAGTSFVSPEMFGTYAYGSPLLNVTFDPTVDSEFASYAFDDEGSPATRQYLIRNGILERPLGGATSQARAGLPGVANARACSWNRPPIDRMANLNVEAGTTPLEQLIASVERGVYMQTNVSWSIDDARNKFQFGCEWGRLIEDGRLTTLVRNPSYRGISATFWRSLKGVGDANSRGIYGTPWCGKGEPAQIIRVGHASPACLFGDVEIFGGEA